MNLIFDWTTLPILDSCDVVVIGGSFGGVAAALTLARSGRRVVLMEPRTYLGREITATLRPWITVSSQADSSALPELISVCIATSGMSARPGEIPLRLKAVKTCLEDLLLAAGVKLVYASLPVGLCLAEDGLQGVVIGNKSGRQVLLGQVLLDATETALTARLAGAKFETEPDSPAHFRYTLEFDEVGQFDETVLSVPDSLGIVNNTVTLHSGYRGQGHVLIECEFVLPWGEIGAVELTQREALVQQKTTDLAAYLLSQIPVFNQAWLAASSYELWGPHTSRLVGPTPDWVHLPDSVTVNAVGQEGAELQTPVASFAGPAAGIWCLNESARVAEQAQVLIRDPIVSSQLGTSLANVLHHHWRSISAPTFKQEAKRNRKSSAFSASLQVKESKQPQRGRNYKFHPIAASSIPILRTTEVLIVGGGTSGAIAAITAAREGMQTALIEMNPGLGGTGIYGGIHSYWFGQRVGFAARIITLVNQMHERLHYEKLKEPIPEWNIEAKARALMQEARTAGVEIVLNALAIGAVVEGNIVRGVVVATRTGPIALLGQVIIDASGDGDVAAWAGAAYVYGSERDHTIMYSYMPQVAKPGRPRNVKTSMADISNIEDYTRVILAERRRGEETDHDHGIYLAPRESRHIRGDIVLTLNDQLLRRSWPDTVYFAFSNHDIKGESASDWLRVGLQPPNLEIEIPYRALLPKDIENILVVGKAFSITHDGLAAPRMQSDLENLGGIAAMAAVMAIHNGQTPRSINVQALQKQLVRAEVLPAQILNRTLIPLEYTDSELKILIDSLEADRPLYTYSDMEIGEHYKDRIPLVDVLCAGSRVTPLLEQAFNEAKGTRQVLLALALAMLGSQVGVPILVSTIRGQLEGEQLPERKSKIRHVGFPPDQAAAPDVVYLIYALGLARNHRILPIWQRIVDLLASATEEEIMDRRKGFYYYVTAVCYGAERLGDPAAISILKKLHSYPPFHNQVSVSGFQVNHLKERLAFLELLIGRALARCGSPDGFVILINYLNDTRALLAEHAHTELIAITGQDFGKNMAAWSQWLENEGEKLKPNPWLAPTEPMTAWNQVILKVVDYTDRSMA